MLTMSPTRSISKVHRPKGGDVNPLNDPAQDLGGLGAAVWGIEGFMQVLNLAPIQFGKIGMKSGAVEEPHRARSSG